MRSVIAAKSATLRSADSRAGRELGDAVGLESCFLVNPSSFSTASSTGRPWPVPAGPALDVVAFMV